MKKGFTLVELSIVLVIIGLLVGGILVGQSLINSAKTQAQIRQIQQFDIAVTQFKAKFKFLPGDSPKFPSDGDGNGAGIGFGDGNNLLQANRAGYSQQFCQTAVYIGECDEFWKQLGDTGMIKNTYTNDYTTGILPDIGAPRAIYKHTTVLPYYNPVISANKNYFILQGNTTNAGIANLTRGPALTSIEVVALDTKLDDGLAASGTVLGIAAPINDVSPVTQCLSAGVYDLNNKDQVCSPLFEMLAVGN